MNISSINLQLFDLIINADILVKGIMVILLAFSIWSWTIIFDKMYKFKMLNTKTARFEKMFWSGQLLEDIYKKVKNGGKYPSAVIFNAAMQEWENANAVEIAQNNDVNKKVSLKERIADVMSVAISRSIFKLRAGINTLLIVGSVSTLFGLLGTVWGIMQSFQSISLMKDASLITIAPGISSALITTVMGLVAAIPALIAYYVFNYKANNFEEEMENFSLELLSILSRELE